MNRSGSPIRHRRRALRLSSAAIAVVAAALAIALPGRATGYAVQAVNYEYVAPAGGSGLTVSVGDQVTWQASGDPHTVTSGTPGAIDDRFLDHPASEGFLVSGDLFTTSFGAPGTYPYFCEVHFETMLGTIVVVETATPAATPAPTPAATPAATKAPTPRPSPAPTPRSTPPATVAPTATPVPPSTAPSASDTPTPTPSSTPIPTASSSDPTPTATSTPTGDTGATASGGGPSALPIVLAGIVAAGVLGGLLLARRRGGSIKGG